jgi:hypothetical protein
VTCGNHSVSSHDDRSRRFVEVHNPPKPRIL